MSQKNTSANTSINKNKMPAIYEKAVKCGFLKEKMVVLDYGCGKYTENLQRYIIEKGSFFVGYDKYNLSEPYNNMALRLGILVGYDLVLCSNVLNVIDDDEEMKKVIRNCVDMTKTVALFTVYENKKNGKGEQTKEDCYQRNEPIEYYEKVISDMCYKVKKVSGMLVVSK